MTAPPTKLKQEIKEAIRERRIACSRLRSARRKGLGEGWVMRCWENYRNKRKEFSRGSNFLMVGRLDTKFAMQVSFMRGFNFCHWFHADPAPSQFLNINPL